MPVTITGLHIDGGGAAVSGAGLRWTFLATCRACGHSERCAGEGSTGPARCPKCGSGEVTLAEGEVRG